MDATSGLDPTHPHPTPAEWRAFAARLLYAAGLGALGAGVIFFVAANWQAWGLLGRFALLQAALLICIAAALWRPPPQRNGQAALLLATLFTGALLALFGQSYQTGADVHELFFTWALLTLPFAVAALSGAVWAVWWGVLDVGLGLLCGWLVVDHFFWRVIDGWGWDRSALLMLPCLANLFGAGLFLLLRSTRFVDAAPLWLLRLLLTLGLAYGTAASLPHTSNRDQGATVLALYALISIGIGVTTWMRRQDVFPLTALAGSWITISTAWLAHSMRLNDIGELFMIAMWLIASSTVAGMLLMRWLRHWRVAAAVEGAAS
jgi:uncharacterized membrane protein